MAILSPYFRGVYNQSKLNPASIYSTPAMPVYYPGLTGMNAAGRYNMQRYAYTLQQMAQSPFAVNNEQYIDRIRDEYGYKDNGLYETYGTIGGLVGAAVGVGLSSGYLQSPLQVNPITRWKRKGVFSTQEAVTGEFNPRHMQRRYKFYEEYNLKKSAVNLFNDKLEVYNDASDKLKDAQKKLELLEKEKLGLKHKSKYLQVGQDARIRQARKLVTQYGDDVVEAGRALDKASEAAEFAGISKTVLKKGTKLGTKIAGFAPGVGIAIDVASLGLSVAGLTQAIKAEDPLSIGLNTVGVVADAADVLGDILTIAGGAMIAGGAAASATGLGAIPGLVSVAIGTSLAGIGATMSTVAGIVSLGMSAITGWLVGETAGRSFSPEGAKAQQLYGENLYSGMVHRPITTLATTGVLVGLPIGLGAMSRIKNPKNLFGYIGRSLTHNALGNQVRAGVSMLSLQGISQLTTKLEDQWIDPESIDNLSSVSAIALYGDINDNLYGATRNKATLLGLVTGDENAMVEALGRSWGRGDDIYKSVTFDDIREAAGLDLTPIGNSVFSTLGELLIDPQNAFEVKMKMHENNVLNSSGIVIRKILDTNEGVVRMSGNKGIEGTVSKLVDETGILSRSRFPNEKARDAFIQRLVKGFLDNEAKGITDVLQNYAVSQMKTTAGTMSINQYDIGANTLILKDFFDKLFNKNYDYTPVNTDMYRRMRMAMTRYNNMKNQELSEADEVTFERVAKTGMFLERMYGPEYRANIVKNFIEDFSIDIDANMKHMQKMYATFTDTRHHMDLTDAAARVIMTTSNPLTKGAQGIISNGSRFMSTLKAKTTDVLHRMRETAELKEIIKNNEQGNVYTPEQVNKIKEEHKYQSQTLDEMLAPKQINKDVDEEIYGEAKDDLEQITVQAAKDTEEVEAAITKYEEAQKKLKNQKKSYGYVGRTYTFKQNQYIISDSTLEKNEQDLELLRGKAGIQATDPVEAYKEALRKRRDPLTRNAARTYLELFNALADYKYEQVRMEHLDLFIGTVKTAISTLGIPAYEINSYLTELIKVLAPFKYYSNDEGSVTKLEGFEQNLETIKNRVDELVKLNEELRLEIIVQRKIVRDNRQKAGTQERIFNTETQEYETIEITQKEITDAQDKLETLILDKQYTTEQLTRLQAQQSKVEATVQKLKDNPDLNTELPTRSFDLYNILAMADDKTLDAYDRILPMFGIPLVAIQKDNQGNEVEVEIKSLKAFSKSELVYRAPIALRVKPNLNFVLQRIVVEELGMDHLDLMLRGMVKVPEDFKKQWIEAKTPEEQINLFREFMKQFGLDKTILNKLRTGKTMLNIYDSIDAAVRADNLDTFIPLNKLDLPTLRAIIMSRFFADTKSDLYKSVTIAQEQFKKAQDLLDKAKDSEEYKDNNDWRMVFARHVAILNTQLSNNPVFQYLSAYFDTGRIKEDDLQLFFTPELDDYIPRPIWDSVLKKVGKEKVQYTARRLLNEVADNKAYKEIVAEAVEPALDTAIKIHNRTIDETEFATIKNKRSEQRKEQEEKRERTEKYKGKVESEANKLTQRDVQEIETNNVHLDTGINVTRFVHLDVIAKLFNIKFPRRLSSTQKAELMNKLVLGLLRGDIDDLGFNDLRYTINPTKYVNESDGTTTSYFRKMNELRRGIAGHRNYLYKTGLEIIRLIRANGGVIKMVNNELVVEGGKIKLDVSKLEKARSKQIFSYERHLANRIALTYERKGKIELSMNPKNSKYLTTIYNKILRKAAIHFIMENPGNPLITLNNINPEDVDVFIKELIHETSAEEPMHVNARAEIFKIASKLFNKELINGGYFEMHNKLIDITDRLLDREQDDIAGIHANKYQVAQDAPKKMMFSNSDFRKLVNAIIAYGDIEDFSGEPDIEHPLFRLLYRINNYMSEDYKKRSFFKPSQIAVIDYKPDPNIKGSTENTGVFYIATKKGKAKPLSLFTLMFKYDFNLKRLSDVLSTYIRKELQRAPGREKELNDMRVSVLAEYENILQQYGGMITRNIFDLSKEQFLKNGGTSKQYQVIQDGEYNVLYRLLTLKDTLITDRAASTDKVQKQYKDLALYHNTTVHKIYQESRKAYFNQNELTQGQMFLKHLLEAPNFAGKKEIIKKVFFYDVKILSGHIKQREGDNSITVLEEKVKNKVGREEDQIINKIRLRNAKEMWNKTKHNKLRNFDDLYAHLISNPDEAMKIYRNVIKGGSGDYVMAYNKATNEYVMVQDRRRKGTNVNRNITGIEGAEHLNEYLGEYVIKTETNDDIKDRAELGLELERVKKHVKNPKIVEANKYGVIITVDNTKNERDVLIKNAGIYRKDFGLSNSTYKIFFITDEEYQAIKKAKDYTHQYTVKEENGTILGETLNIINVKGQFDKVPAYIDDILKIDNTSKNKNHKSVNVTVKELIRFIDVFENVPRIREAFVGGSNLNQTETFKTLKGQAQVHKALLEFLDILDPTGNYDFNMEYIINNFFKDYFIKFYNNKQFDVNDIEVYLNNPEEVTKLKSIKVDGVTLYIRLQRALRMLQEKYGHSELIFNKDTVLSPKFLDNVNTLTNKAKSVLYKLRQHNNKLYFKVVQDFDKEFRAGYITTTTANELRERRAYTKDLDGSLMLNGDYRKDMLNPYTHGTFTTVDKIIETIKGQIRQADDNNETEIVNHLRNMRASHAKRSSEVNKFIRSARRKKAGTINFGFFWNMEKRIRTMRRLRSSKNPMIPLEFIDLGSELNGKLKIYTRKMFDMYKAFEKSTNRAQQAVYKNMVHAGFRINNFEDFHNAVLFEMISPFTNNIALKISKLSELAILQKAGMTAHIEFKQGKITKDQAEARFEELVESIKKEQKEWKAPLSFDESNYNVIVNGGDMDIVDYLYQNLFTSFTAKGLYEQHIPKRFHIADSERDELYGVVFDAINSVRNQIYGEKISLETIRLKDADPAVKDADNDIADAHANLKEYLDTLPTPEDRSLGYFVLIAKGLADHSIPLKTIGEAWKAIDWTEGISTGKLPDDFFKTVYRVRYRARQKRERFANPKEVYYLKGTPTLDDDIEFKQYVGRYLFSGTRAQQQHYLGNFGLAARHKTLFDKANTMREFIDEYNAILVVSKKGHKAIQEMYAFTSIINMLKDKFIEPRYGKNPNWDKVQDYYVRNKPANASQLVRATRTMGFLSSQNRYDNSVLQRVDESTRFIFEALGYTKEMNRKLGSIIIDPAKKISTKFDASPVYATTVPNEISVLRLQIQNEFYGGIFEYESTTSVRGVQQYEMTKALGDMVHDFLAEEHAKTLEDVGSTNVIYHQQRKLFTDAAVLLRSKTTPEQFIRMRDIGITLKQFKANTDEIAVFLDIYKEYTATIKGIDEHVRLETAINEIVKFYNKRSYLVKVTAPMIKAALARILYYRHDRNKFKIEELAQRHYDAHIQNLEVRHNIQKEKLNSIAYLTHPKRDMKDISILLFGTTKITDEQRTLLQRIQNLHEVIAKGSRIDPLRIYDTWDRAARTRAGREAPRTTTERILATARNEKIYIEGRIEKLIEEQKQIKQELSRKHKVRIRSKSDLNNIKTTTEAAKRILNERETKIRNELTKLEDERTKINNDILNQIALLNPNIIGKYLQERFSLLDTTQEKIDQAREIATKKLHPLFMDEFLRRRNAIRTRKEFFKSYEYEMFKEVATWIDDLGFGYDNMYITHKDVFRTINELHIDDTNYTPIVDDATLKTWLDDMRKKRTEINEASKFQKDPGLIDPDTNKKIYFITANRRLTKVYDRLDKQQRELNTKKERISGSIEDWEAGIKYRLVAEDLNDTLKMYNAASKNNFDQAFKRSENVTLTEDQRSRLTTRVEEHIDNLQRRKRFHQKKARELGFSGAFNTLDKAYNTALELYKKQAGIDSDKHTKQMEITYNYLRSIRKDIDDDKQMIETLKRTNIETKEELLRRTGAFLLGKNAIDLTEESLVEVAKYLSGDETVELRTDIKQKKAELTGIRDIQKEHNDVIKTIDVTIPENNAEVQRLRTSLEGVNKTIRQRMRESEKIKQSNLKEAPYDDSNLGTFKNHYEDDYLKTTGKTFNDSTDEEIIGYILDKTAQDADVELEHEGVMYKGVNALKRLIENAGYDDKAYEIHNAVVDVLITRMNYLAQADDPKQTFTVLDMETATSEGQHTTPYQIVILKQYVEKGKKKIAIFDTYFNNYIFKDVDAAGKPGEDLRVFYEQQYDMLKEQYPQLTDAEIEARTEALLNKIRKTKNDPIFLEMFISILHTKETNPEDHPIITHNGIRFDMPHYETFMQSYANRLLRSVYFQETNKIDPKEIRNRLGSANLMTLVEEGAADKLIEEYDKQIKHILYKMQKGIQLTDNEINNLRAFNRERSATRLTSLFSEIEKRHGFIVDPKVREVLFTGKNSQTDQLKTKLFHYLNGDNRAKTRIRKEFIKYFEDGFKLNEPTGKQHKKIVEFTDVFLEEAAKEYQRLLDGGEIDYKDMARSRIKRNVERAQAEIGLEGEVFKWIPGDILAGHDITIRNLLQNKGYYEGLDVDVETTVKNLQLKRTQQQAEVYRILDEIDQYEREIKTSIKNEDKVFDQIHELSAEIHRVLANPSYNAAMVIKNTAKNIIDEMDDVHDRYFGTRLIRYEMSKHLEKMEELILDLEELKDLAYQLAPMKVEDAIKKIAENTHIDERILGYKTKQERTDLITEIKKDITRLEEYINMPDKYETEMVEYVKGYQTTAEDTVKTIYEELIKLWNTDETKLLLNTQREMDPYKKGLAHNPDTYNDLFEILKNNKHLQDNSHFKALRKLLKPNSDVYELIDVLSKTPKELLSDNKIERIIKHGITKEISILNEQVDILQRTVPKDKSAKTIGYQALSAKYKEVMAEAKYIEALADEVHKLEIFNAAQRKTIPTKDMSMTLFTAEATKQLGKEYIEKLHDKNVKRIYNDARINDDKFAIILDPENVYANERRTDGVPYATTIGKYDEHNHDMHRIEINHRSGELTLFLKYHYRQYGMELVEHKPLERKIKFRNAAELYKWREGFFKTNTSDGVVKGVTEDEIYKIDGVDRSLEALDNLITFIKEHHSSKATQMISNMRSKLVYDRGTKGLNIKDLKIVNMSRQMQDRFLHDMDILMNRNANYKDIVKLYAGHSHKLLSKFNSTVPGKVLNMIPSEYSIGYITDYTPRALAEFGKKHGIKLNLMQSSEGSAGTSFMLESKYTVSLPFLHSTNPIRTILSNGQLYTNFTAFKLINDMYAREDGSKNTLSEYLNFQDKDLAKWFKKEYNGKQIEIFTPNVATKDMFEKYQADILHKKGVNVKVGFFNLPKAYEDTILVDETFLKRTGWGVHNKTWLGLYGFKGAVQVVRGLEKKYGAVFVANGTSISKRGANGVVLEMAMNNIRNYIIGNDSDIHPKALKELEAYSRDALKEKLGVEIEDGKIIVDPNVDYADMLKTMFQDWRSRLVKVDINKTEHYTDAKGNDVPVKIRNGYIGEVYVMLDSEHVAEHMATTTRFTDDGGIITTYKDARGGLDKGFSISPTVVYTMMAKGHNVDWLKAFPMEDTKLKLYSKVSNFGISALIDMYRKNPTTGKERTDLELVEALEASQDIGNLGKLVQEYLTYYRDSLDKTIDAEARIFADYRMKEIDYRAKVQAHESLTSRHGARYKSIFRRHDGIREQLVANLDLRPGEIKTSAGGFMAMLKMKPENWLMKNGVPLKDQELEDFVENLPDYKKDLKGFIKYIADAGIEAYVLAARSPVQDYNAVPVLKIKGISIGAATEANAYLYSMIGGDNDGDTLGMTPLEEFQLDALAPKNDKGIREGLDATNLDYYDKFLPNKDRSYLEDVDGDIQEGDLTESQDVTSRLSYTGKQTFEGTRDKADVKGYRWDELFILAFGDKVIKDISEIKLTTKEKEDADQLFEKSKNKEANKRFYVNVIVRALTKGNNTLPIMADVFGKEVQVGEFKGFDKAKINEMFNSNKALIYKRFAFDQRVTKKTIRYGDYLTDEAIELYSYRLGQKDQDRLNELDRETLYNSTEPEIQDLRDKIMFMLYYDTASMSTVQRIQSSKRGINELGGERKKQFIASYLSRFENMNKDSRGNTWNPLRAEDGSITPAGIGAKIFGDTGKFLTAVNTTKSAFISKNISRLNQNEAIKADAKAILEFLWNAHDGYKQTREDLLELFAYKEGSKSLKQYGEYLLKHPVKGKDPIVQEMVARWKAEEYKEVSEIDEMWLKVIHFGRFTTDADKFWKRMSDPFPQDPIGDRIIDNIYDEVTKYSTGYLDQRVIDRAVFNDMSNKASKIIAVSKHYGIDTNSVKFINEYGDLLRKLTDELGIRRVITTKEDYDYGMAIGMDADPFERNNISLNRDAISTLEDNMPNPVPKVNALAKEITVDNAQQRLNNLINGNMRVSLFNTIKVPDHYFRQVMDAATAVTTMLQSTRDLSDVAHNPTFIQHIRTLIRHNVPAYKLERAIQNSISMYNYVNRVASTKGLDKDLKIPKDSLLQDSSFFFEMLTVLHIPEERVRLEAETTIPKIVRDYFLNNAEKDPSFIIEGDEDFDVQDNSEINYQNLIAAKTNIQETIAEFSSGRNDLEKLDPLTNMHRVQQQSTEEMLRNLSLVNAKRPQKLTDIINDRLINYDVIEKMYQYKARQLEETEADRKTRAYHMARLVDKHVFNYDIINSMIKETRQEYNRYLQLEEKKTQSEKKLVHARAELDTTLEEQNVVDEIKTYFEGIGNKEAFGKRFDDLIQQANDKRTKVKQDMAAHAFDTVFTGVELLHDPDSGLNLRKYYLSVPQRLSPLRQEDVETFKESKIANMDVYQTPFLKFVEFHTKTGDYNNPEDYDWDGLYDWYMKDRRFHRLTVVMDGYADEGALKQLHDVLRKEDNEWENKTKEEKRKFKNIKKHYMDRKFNNETELKDFMEIITRIDTKLYYWYTKQRDVDSLENIMKHFNNKKFMNEIYEMVKAESQQQYKNVDDFMNAIKKLPNSSDLSKMELTLDGTTYEGVEGVIETGAFISPTMKEIIIRGPEDFKKLFEYIKTNGEKMIGFTDMDSFMNATEQAYNPYRMEGRFADIIAKLQHHEKLMMRFSAGFLFRNWTDTWNQIMTHNYNEMGVGGMLLNAPEVINYMFLTGEIYKIYKAVNEERILTLTDIELRYTDIERILNSSDITEEDALVVIENIKVIRDKIDNYVKADVPDTEYTKRITHRKKRGEYWVTELNRVLKYIDDKIMKPGRYENIKDLKYIHERLLKRSTTYLLDLRFAEFFTMYESLRVNPKDVYNRNNMFGSLRNTWERRHKTYIENVKARGDKGKKFKGFNYDDFKHILFEISAFMQTNAQLDIYKQEDYKYLYGAVNHRKELDDNDIKEVTYEEVVKALSNEKRTLASEFKQILTAPMSMNTSFKKAKAYGAIPAKIVGAIGNKVYDVYDGLNSYIESTGRIAGYLFDRHMHGYTFNETVNRSLKRFFNYGYRGPTEMQLLSDIPYLSFPIRSIDNWIERLTNPAYIRFMSDVVDGFYGQYEDEDGQYDEYTKYLISSGWIPIVKGFGIRVGNGALDIQNLITNASELLEQRRRPVLRAINTLIQTQDFEKSIANLATVGVVSRVANTLAPRSVAQNTPVIRQNVSKREWDMSNAFGFTFSYGNSTPYKYRDNYPRVNNGRYKRYENIYNQWFNKYGRMRKPPSDPLSLVKDIQWKQYVRWRQSRNMSGYYR